MSNQVEHDYIGLSEVPSPMEESSDKIRAHNNGLNLKATELRLGLPGSQSPERREDHDGGPLALKSFVVSGAKRGFSDCLDGRGNWGFSAGSDALFSPKGGAKGPDSGLGGGPGLKDGAGLKPVMAVQDKKPSQVAAAAAGTTLTSKAQVVGWPPIRSFRKNSMAALPAKNNDDTDTKLGPGCMYVKVSMDGAPYLRKVDLRIYSSYKDLSSALEKMFGCFTIGQCSSNGVPAKDRLSASRLMDLLHGSEYVLTYEDKDGDWMLVGDVPWEMFTNSCKKLRIMKSSEAIGLAPRAMEKCRNLE